MSQTTVSKAETKYPIFAATFAYNNPAILAVGGGGGAGRSGVPNAISVFDTSSRSPKLDSIAEIDLSRDEDSVTCLESLATKDGIILYAGINSSEVDRSKGNNEHFRSFEVKYPKEKGEKASGKLEFLGKSSLFTPPTSATAKKEVYQRLVRLSPPKLGKSGSKRIGAVASSLGGDENEIVIFPATSTKPNASEVIQRIPLHKGQEANDIDILEVEDGKFHVVYVTDQSVYLSVVHGSKKDVRKLYEVPFPDVFEKKGRPKLRGIRFLSPSHILLLSNAHNRTGVELLVLRLYDEGAGSITMRKRLPGHVKAAVDLDVARLDADDNGAYQSVVAVAGHDCSLSIYSIDYLGSSRNSLGSFVSFATYRDVHPFQLTKAVFSPFLVAAKSTAGKPKAQYLRLASTSLGNSISVETFELKFTSSKAGTRYILQSPHAGTIYKVVTSTGAFFVLLFVALMVQSLLDPQGNLTKAYLPTGLTKAASGLKPPGAIMHESRVASAKLEAAAENIKVPVEQATRRIKDILDLHAGDESSAEKAVVIHDDPETDASLNTEVHADTEEVVKRHAEAKQWDDLSHAEQNRWRHKLMDAGVWAVEEGETILKGIFFSEAAGIVRHVAEGVIHG
ncbi:hypothetical protein BU24DRAFT_422607 [Aaosphaeria arxii CBS 175.79]|uniref:Guanine nucleotide-exchange factor SEC12 n=1 Tax=Aaosphaeria arxii CBS 175.79 TaxID=1450172 RepID=A0A6A5XTM6_9PLEO|nr:uncharacterized protein BU24DRAFT_422607 [Aaosphaeria arxii CBS 175.79]KAF2016269.1 hypothetical protein BU24DRAFT_422607 [Aaosphaeria arxii CBS 175.79]